VCNVDDVIKTKPTGDRLILCLLASPWCAVWRWCRYSWLPSASASVRQCRTDALALTVSKQGCRVANFSDRHTPLCG